MDRIPDSPEGVALALVALILGCGDLGKCAEARDANEVLSLFRRCLDTVRGEAPYISREERLRTPH